mgnify:CR=1 FL=1
MRKHLRWMPIILIMGFSCSQSKMEEEAVPLSSQELKFEIYDSLVVDFLGNMYLMDISPNQESFLLIDQTTDSMFVADSNGKIQHRFLKQGDGPGLYPNNRMAIARFLSDEEFIIPTQNGFYRYDNSGNFIENYKPDFDPYATLLVQFADNLGVKEGEVYMFMRGRYITDGKEEIDYQKTGTLLEKLDLTTGKFEPAISFPRQSRFYNSENTYPDIAKYTNINLYKDTLYLSLRNEAKLYAYSLDQLDSPAWVMDIPFEEFIAMEPQDEENVFRIRDFFTGTINKAIPLGNGEFLIDYLSGLTDDVANEITNGDDFSEMFRKANEKNTAGVLIFDGNSLSHSIEKDPILGTMNKVVSKDEVWFSLNFEEVENDYSVIYKTRIVAK